MPRRPACLLLATLLGTAPLLPAQEPALGPTTDAFRERKQRRESFRTTRVREAIGAGVGWLRAHQDADGRWDCDDFGKHDGETPCDGEGQKHYDVGVTALALLALLAQADTEHDAACRRAAEWLVSQVDPVTGRVRSVMHDFVYEQALTTMALAEAAELLDEVRARKAATAGMRYLQGHHNAGAAWRYQPGDGESDTSISSWCIVAGAACHTAGIDVDPTVLGHGLAWIDSATDPWGRTGYSKRGEMSSRLPGGHAQRFPTDRGEAMTAAAQHVRHLLDASSPIDEVAEELLLTKLPVADAPARDFYYWLHGSLAFGPRTGSGPAKKWEAALQKALLGSQRTDATCKGSWDPDDAWGDYGGRIYATATNVLSLSAPYRCRRADTDHVVPDAPPWRGVHALWSARKFGAAVTTAETVVLAADDVAGNAVRSRIVWRASLFAARAERLMADLEGLVPDLLDRYRLLAGFADELSPLPAGEQAAAHVARMDGDKTMRTELEASRELRKLQVEYAAVAQSNNRSKQKQLQKQLEKLAERHPDTEAAKAARELAQRLP